MTLGLAELSLLIIANALDSQLWTVEEKNNSNMKEHPEFGYEILHGVYSIYEKLIKMCGIDEQGTNYPPVCIRFMFMFI